MQAMHVELNALRQAPELGAAANGPVPVAPSGVATGGGEPVVPPQRPLELRDWCGMSLEKFAGTGAPIEAADWLSAVIDKLESFQVPALDWRNVQLSRLAARGPITWIEFDSQFERRFYPIAFVDKMKTQLERCHQGKRTVAEYEMDFKQIVRFVPHVVHDEYEKARIFRQGLKASIRRVLRVFVLEDFHSTVERALGVEVQDDYTEELRGGIQSQAQKDQKGHSGGSSQKDKHRRHHPYSGSSSQSRASGGGSRDGSTQYRATVRPGLGLVCFRCGDAHRRADCRWNGQFSRCGKDHKELVCRKNPNSKIIWEPLSSSSSGQHGTAHMMTGFLPASFVPQYLPTSSSQQFLPAPLAAPMLGSSPAPAPGGAYWLSQSPTPSATMWTPTPAGIPRRLLLVVFRGDIPCPQLMAETVVMW
ncbi:hypothetical protein PVAP13_9NG420414 [Panicum virgatum]|uniref:Retrotransposon gag domain-containing protein n=1 Tax=Panicum virgatum TaxID=38727 RepID=A0A8T0MNG0_PANVG|nr:hypothetical protein PVAP13_9NG420414 [Panicum virgatum]